jgi:AcrR family transcriptional regulator
MATVEEYSPPRRTRLPAAQRRETILRAAAEVFGESGYRAARMSDIAARVGVTEPVVFQNFGSKPALFAAALEHAAGQARASLEDAAAQSGAAGSAGRLLAHVLGQLSPGQAGRPGQPGEPGEPGGGPDGHDGHDGSGTGPGALFADAIALAADPALAEVSGQVLRTLAWHLADLVRRGQQDGSVRAGLAPEPAAWLLISVLAGRPLRQAAMPAGLEPQVADLAAGMLGLTAEHTAANRRETPGPSRMNSLRWHYPA